jgi:pimeloyl-ACP methyl ester carboxylesterase
MKRVALAALAAVFVVVGGGRQALTPGSGEARAAVGRCYMAFIHGSGDDFFDENPRASAAIDRYWSSDGSNFNSFLYYAARVWAGEQGCVVWRVGYDGNQQWWHARAAGRVAASLHDFIDEHQIPDGGLVLVGHSMGGLVARYVINQGTPQAPFYNEYTWMDPRMDYDLVRRKTAHVIAVQAPNTGAQASDALFGQADHGLSNTGADVVRLLGMRDRTPATSVMTRPYMEAAGAPGGEMGDEARQVVIYTIAGTDTGDNAGLGMDDDKNLDLAWILLCYKSGARNSWGAACQWDFWNFSGTRGDGLVEQASAHARWMRGRANGQPTVGGAWRAWLDVIHNHNQGRYDALLAPVTDHLRGIRTPAYLGSYIGGQAPAL